jgi:hypothetical protein
VGEVRLLAAGGANRQSDFDATGAAMTRGGQVRAALKLLDPPPHERQDCQRHVEYVLDRVNWAGRNIEHAKVTRKNMRAYSTALRKLQDASQAHHRAGGILLLPTSEIDRMVACNEQWSCHWQPPSRRLKHRTAVALAYELLTGWKPSVGCVVSRTGAWHRLATVVFGDPRANLYRHLRAFAAEIRSRPK